MTSFIDFGFYGDSFFMSPSPPVRQIHTAKISNAIFDEVHIKEEIETAISPEKEEWKVSTRLKAMFQNDLEAGNIRNNGIKIEKFAIKRRGVGEIRDITLDYQDFENDKGFTYVDYTQPNEKLIYSVIPIGENELEGQPNSVEIESDFVGYFIVDKDTDEVLTFDKFIDSEEEVSSTLNQGRVEIQTMSRFPQVYYTGQEHHTFSLSTVIVPNDWERSGKEYERLLNKFVRQYKPFIVKGSNGEIYVADVHSPVKTNPMNTWKERDYIQLTVEIMEIDDYFEFMQR